MGSCGSYLNATSTFFGDEATAAAVRDLLEQLERRHLGPHLRQQLQRLRLLHRRLPAALRPDRQPRLGRVQRARLLRLELRRPARDRELAVRQQRGRLRHQQPERRQPAAAGRRVPEQRRSARSPTRTRAGCSWTTTSTTTTTPTSRARGSAAAGPVGTGMSISGGRNDTVMDNTFANNNAWGIILVPYPDTARPCTGGTPGGAGQACLYDEYGDAIVGNTFHNNGGFGNPTNGDIAELNFEAGHATDCYSQQHRYRWGADHLSGRLAAEPSGLQRFGGARESEPAVPRRGSVRHAGTAPARSAPAVQPARARLSAPDARVAVATPQQPAADDAARVRRRSGGPVVRRPNDDRQEVRRSDRARPAVGRPGGEADLGVGHGREVKGDKAQGARVEDDRQGRNRR